MTTREVALEGGAPWGFRMHGGRDSNQQLRISRVNPGSKAAQRGIREGDLISSINGQSTKDLTNSEAHGLLRNAGDVLKLGLNEETSGSPKRRQYRTIHQETLQETVKRSSVTTYSIKKTVETVESDKNNENSLSRTDCQARINGTSKGSPQTNNDLVKRKSPLPSSSSNQSSPTLIKEGDFRYTSTDFAEASSRSSYTNCTLSPSSPSVFSEDGNCGTAHHSHLNDKQNVLDNMNDNQSSSRSQKRRQRRKNRKIHENASFVQNSPNNCDNKLVLEPSRVLQEEYLVHSPAELVKKRTKAKPVKSKSLDDDDTVKIQELSETSEAEDKEKDTYAIVSEASESEVEWEETMSLASTSTPLQGTLSTLTLPLEGYSTEQVTLISPEEEKSLRNFLEGLNLVNGPEEAAFQIYEKNTTESIKQRKAKKRAALEQYFTPICQNPRFLDAISEEASDKDSDKEQSSLTRHLKQGTPELDVPPKIPPRLNRHRRQDLPAKFAAPIEQAPAILVDAKILEHQAISEGSYSTVRTEEASASTVEVVFLTSSGTDSPEEVQNGSSDSYELDATDETGETNTTKTDHNGEFFETFKSDRLDESCEVLEPSKPNETTRSTSSTHYSFTIKTDKGVEDDQKIIENGLLSQLTPPPTPENLSPKYRNIIVTEAAGDSLEDSPVAGTHYTMFVDKDLNSEPLDIIADHENNLAPCAESCEVYTNVLTPPPPSRSSSSSRSSSRESSQCTARYNPSTSSIIEILSREEDEPRLAQPLTLRELCLKFLITLPHGKEVLQELADVSKHIDSYTRSLPGTILPKLVPNIAHLSNTTSADVNNVSYDLSVQSQNHTTLDNIEIQDSDKDNSDRPTVVGSLQEKTPKEVSWRRGRPEDKKEEDLALKQNSLGQVNDLNHTKNLQNSSNFTENIDKIKKDRLNELEQSKVKPAEIPKEERLIPIQLEEEKSIPSSIEKTRNIPVVIEKATPKSEEVIIPIQKDWEDQESKKEVNMTSMNRRHMPIRREWFGLPPEDDRNNKSDGGRKISDEASKLLELHEKYVNKKFSQEEINRVEEEKVTVTNTSLGGNRLLTIIKEEPSATAEDSNYLYFVEKEPKSTCTLPRTAERDRLNAKDLTEWLNLARNKSMSESNLNSASAIPENNLRSYFDMQSTPAAPRRRTSLPHVLYEKQLMYIQEKERQIQRQLEELEEEKRMLNAEVEPSREFNAEDYYFSPKGDFAESKKRNSLPAIPGEFFRQQMYEEYMDKFAEREERRQHKVIKVTSSKDPNPDDEKAGAKEIVHPIQLEDEFMDKVKQKQKEGKLEKVKSLDKEGSVVRMEEGEPVLVIDGEKLREVKALPKHLQEFVVADGIWSPGQKLDSPKESYQREKGSQKSLQDESIPPIWTPKSASSSPTAERKEFKSVNFQSPVLGRKTRTKSENLGSDNPTSATPWRIADYSSDTGLAPISSDRRIPTSYSSPASGFTELSVSTRLPKAQNPTITLLQKAREGQLPRGAHYIDQEQRQYRPKNDRPPIAGPSDVLYQIKHEYTSESESERPRKMADLGPRKFEGIGPVSKDGMPLILRSELKDQNQSKWYKRMYDTIHKQKPHSDEYVTVRYKQKRAQYPYSSGYLSEPEPGAYDSDFTDYKYQTLDRRRPTMQEKAQYATSTMPRPSTQRSSSTDILRNSHDYYKNQPGRIENYTPGHSSISEREAKEWWDEVMDIFDGHLEQQKRAPPHPRSFINQALKESGYESDSTLVFRRKEEAALQLNPNEQKQAYKVIQKGGDVPLKGLRKLAPERPKETDFVEFFPISPTLTRIRIHKNIKPQKEALCYPITVHQPQCSFADYKRSAPSSAIPTPPPIPPPSPPRRRSSRNNPTLRFVSTMKVKSEKSPVCKRHETCFTSSSNIDKSNVKFLKDKITCKLSPTLGKRSSSPKMKVTKKITTTPDMKGKITSTLTTSRDGKSSSRKIQSKTNVHSSISRSKSTDSVRNLAKLSTPRKSPMNSSVESLNLMKASPKTFGSEKRKFELNIKASKLTKSPDLLSPTEVKKATLTLPSGTTYRKSNAFIASSKNAKGKEVLPIRVGISEKGRSILKTSAPSSPRLPKRSSPCPSTSSEISRLYKSSQESLTSPKMSRRSKETVKHPASSKVVAKGDKAKKEQINDEIKKDRNVHRSDTSSDKSRKLSGRPDLVKKTKVMDDFEPSSAWAVGKKQKNGVQGNHFFQNLFLRDVSPAPSNISRSSWIVEKTNQLARRSSFSEPSISAMKVYLRNTKPVSDSKFISLDIASVRSRSASPKSVSFDNSAKQADTTATKRSSSLPPKLIFSQTSRPVSPVVQHKRLVSPPPSPKLCRSPSCRKIMQFKQLQVEKKPPEYSLYMCPSLNHSTTSLDSLKSEDYQKYFNDLVQTGKKTGKFKDLNQFYSEIEKVGKLERSFSLKPRTRCESEIIDFDRWKEVRTRERAEQELGLLYSQIRAEEKEKGFLYLPKDVTKYKWKREFDRGLRVKEKSVDDIKEEFEKLKKEESDRENAKRRELSSMKDTYKPLWRGSSVVDIANTIVERRSQSEGRVKTARQRLLESEKLLTHGIGSRIWSSLSMEQVNILKEQLADIYNNTPKPKEDYSIQVPKDNKLNYVQTLSVRRNSDSSEQLYKATKPKSPSMSEDDKKLMSQSLSKELLQKLGRCRKENKNALPLVVGREILGAVAAAEARVKTELPAKALIKTNALGDGKVSSTSETESGSTDESTRTVICADKSDEIRKKVEYFEKAKEPETYTPTIYKPAESRYDIGEVIEPQPDVEAEQSKEKAKLFQSKSCQSLKEYFGEKDLVKFATIPLSATRKQKFTPKKPELRATDISPLRSELSATTSNDSLCRSRSISPYEKQSSGITGEVSRLKHKFEYLEDCFGASTLKRSRSESDLHRVYPDINVGYVDSLRRKYEYPAYSGRGRSRTRRGGVVSPIFLRAEDRFMPHINIISKIASLYTKKGEKNKKEAQRSVEELAELLGCPVGEVEKLKEKYDSQEDVSLVGHMYTSSPSIRELKDIAPYLTADWTAHRYPKLEDNTRSLSSPEHSVAARDTSIVRRDRARPKSISPPPKAKKSPSILKPVHKKHRSADFFQNQKYDPKIHEPVARYQPSDVARYKNGWSFCSKPTVSFKDPEPPIPPPKGQYARSLEPESPRKYVENEVTIHYKTPVRQEIKEFLSEDELAHRQAEAMKKIYEEERQRKHLQVSKSLQELRDMHSRRHTDNFIPSQKSPISLNRYDDFDDLAPSLKLRPRSPEPRLCARALYNFVGQTARELTFRKGDIIYIRRQIDKNWYEGELNAMVGLCPTNYVEIVPSEGSKPTPRKAHEGKARAKYNFVAQSHLELSLGRGELVTITRRVDDNWFEGKIGGRKGIFPANYVEVLIDPQTPPPSSGKPVAAPAAHSLLLNGSSGGKESMGTHCYTPTLPNAQLTTSYHAKPVQVTNSQSYGSLNRKNLPMSQALHIETQSEPIPYRAMYKYNPQNDDELELLEGDTVYVLEKCDDGWYVGSSNRTGAFGTFPGNYVEKI